MPWRRRSSRVASAPTQADPEALYFLHIPKTAGTSLWNVVRQHYDERDICAARLWHQLLAVAPDERSDHAVYIGHFYSYLGRVVRRPLRVVTFLRDPVERSLSHYAHVLRDPHHYFHALAVELGSLAAFLEDDRTGALITNFQVRALAQDIDVLACARRLSPGELAGLKLEEHLETVLPDTEEESMLLHRAMASLSTAAFVGIVERYEESLDRLGRVLEWERDAAIQPLNLAPTRVRADDLDDRTMELLHERVRLDQLLYLAACAQFEAGGSSDGSSGGPWRPTPVRADVAPAVRSPDAPDRRRGR